MLQSLIKEKEEKRYIRAQLKQFKECKNKKGENQRKICKEIMKENCIRWKKRKLHDE